MKVLATAGDISALIADVRLRVPLTAWAVQYGGSVVWRSFHDCSRADLAAADVLVLQRGTSARACWLSEAMHARGGSVVYDIDDLITEIAPHISHHERSSDFLPWVRRCMRHSDLVTVSTARLGAALEGLAPACMEVPNHAFSAGDLPLPLHDAVRPVSLLFASSDRLAAEFLYPVLRRLDAHRTRLVLVGPPGADFSAAGLAVERHPLLPRADFIALARSLPNPLAVIPLEASRFASCKSAVKWFDYAEAGIPTLCSAVPPYTDVVEDGVTARLVANDEAAWSAALAAAIGDTAWRERVARAARSAVRSRHTIVHTTAAWQHALEEARRRSREHPLPAPALAWRLKDAIGSVFESGLLRLRRFNRERLARRR